jgi:hypothetical protein
MHAPSIVREADEREGIAVLYQNCLGRCHMDYVSPHFEGFLMTPKDNYPDEIVMTSQRAANYPSWISTYATQNAG